MSLTRLCELASPPLVHGAPYPLHGHFGHRAGDAIHSLLHRKNGFFGFNEALFVFADINVGPLPGIIQWNDPAMWRYAYAGLADQGVFFASDVFGNGFAWRGRNVCQFNVETAGWSIIAQSMDEWASLLIGAPAPWTGQTVLSAWQAKNGPLPRGFRLVPNEPFSLGGEYTVGNLRAMEAVASLRFRAKRALKWRYGVESGVRLRMA